MFDAAKVLDTFTRNPRTQDVFRLVVERYMETRRPVGSLDLSRFLSKSSATIRNDMADLEDLELIKSPHTSAGRIPTQEGLRIFIDKMMSVEFPDAALRGDIDDLKNADHTNIEALFSEASQIVSRLSHYAAFIAAPKTNRVVSYMQFARMTDGKTMAIIVFTDGSTENRWIDVPPTMSRSVLEQASNYMNARLSGKTISEMRARILKEIGENKVQLDGMTRKLVEEGLIISDAKGEILLMRGTANLLDEEFEKIEYLQRLFRDVEDQKTVEKILSAAEIGRGVRVFIGSENVFFPGTDTSLVTAQALGPNQELLGVIGVVGPKTMHYPRVATIVNHTADVMTQAMGGLIAPRLSSKSLS